MNCDEYIPVAVAIIQKDNKILIAKRKRAFMGSPWGFPCGIKEKDENLKECLKKALFKEFDVEVEIGNFIFSQKHVLNCQSAIQLFAFEATHVSGEFQLREYEEIRWISVDELEKYNFPDTDRSIIKFLLGDR